MIRRRRSPPVPCLPDSRAKTSTQTHDNKHTTPSRTVVVVGHLLIVKVDDRLVAGVLGSSHGVEIIGSPRPDRTVPSLTASKIRLDQTIPPTETRVWNRDARRV